MVVSDAAAAVELLRAVFGALGEIPAGRPAEMRIGDSLIMVSSAGERDVFPAFLYVYVDDADAAYHHRPSHHRVMPPAAWRAAT
jgi:PhnB protein